MCVCVCVCVRVCVRMHAHVRTTCIAIMLVRLVFGEKSIWTYVVKLLGTEALLVSMIAC